MIDQETVDILLVDDQPAKPLGYEAILAELGENLIKAGTATEALEQKSTGFLPFGAEFKNPSFAAMAEAIGVRGIRLEDPAEVDDGIAGALAHDGAGADRRGCQPYRSRNASVDHHGDGEGLYSLHGESPDQRRADEVIDLARTNLWR